MRIWSILVLLILMSLGCNRSEEARRKSVANNLKQIGLALHNYHQGNVKPALKFSHVITTETEYYTTGPQQGRPADGKFPAGTKVNIVKKSGSYVLVESSSRIEAYVAADALKKADVTKSDTIKKDVQSNSDQIQEKPLGRVDDKPDAK